jgi:O-antigen/teichoic acid export membrane protein
MRIWINRTLRSFGVNIGKRLWFLRIIWGIFRAAFHPGTIPKTAEGIMFDFKGLYNLRHKILKLGAPALVSRGTLAVWGIIHIFIIRMIPEEAFAAYAVARTFETFGALLGGGFIQQAILKMVSEGDGRREHELANAGVFLALVLAALSAVLLIGMEGTADRFYSELNLAGLPVLLAAVVFTGTVAGMPRALLLTRHRTRDVMYVDLLQFTLRGGIIGALIIGGTLRTGHQIFTATIIANICSFFLSLGLSRVFFFTDAPLKWNRIVTMLNFSLVCLGTATANYIYTSTDIMMLGKIAPGDVAEYGAARSLSGVFAMVNAAANMVLLPLFSRMWRQGQRGLIISRAWSGVLIAELILLPAFIALVFFPKQVLNVVFSGRYVESWPVTMLLGAMILVRPVGSYFSTAALAVGKPQYSLYSVIISSAVNVGLNLLLIRSYGGFGAAMATSVAMILSTWWIVRKAIRYINSRF